MVCIRKPRALCIKHPGNAISRAGAGAPAAARHAPRVAAQQRDEFAARHLAGAQARQMGARDLAVDEPDVAPRHSSTSRARATLEASRSRLNMDSPKNTPAQLDAVQAADQALAAVGLDRVAESQVRAAARRRRSCPRSARCRARSGGAPRRRGWSAPKARSTRVVYAAVAQRLAQASRDLEFVGKQDHARVRRPPQDRLLGRIPGKDAAFVGGEQPLRAAGRRPRPAARAARAAPARRGGNQSGSPCSPSQTSLLRGCNSSSGARW